ncbi:MAG: response regulator [Ardenticatenaceae bacterium]|nr:response regulator [Ardenticatenaceae bacterium]HBY92472.1 response regulator [Chloroflexota bacterium]
MSSLRIMIVDDDSLVALSLRTQLEALGHRVVAEASNGADAIRLAQSVDPDLILMDIKMPEMDGLTASRTIMQDKAAPIILLTSYSDPELVAEADEAGVQAYLVKPVDEAELRPAIQLAISRFRQLQGLAEEVESLKQALADRKLVERAKGILMRRLNLSEEDAYIRLRQQARSRRVKMAEIARSIIQAAELLEQS